MSTAPVRSAEEGPWRVIGPTRDGDTFVARGQPAELWVLTDTDVVRHPSDAAVEQFETGIGRVTTDGTRTLVVEVFAGEGGSDWVLYEDGTSRVVHRQSAIGFPGDDATDFRRLPTYVGDELWWLHQRGEEEPVLDLELQRPDGSVLVVPTPVGRQVVGSVAELSSGTLPDGRPALLLTVVDPFGETSPQPVLVDLDAARVAGGTSTGPVPDGVFTPLDQPSTTRFEP